MPEDELIDVIDEDENIIETLPKSEVRKGNLMRRGGDAIVFNSKGEILIQRRALHKIAEPGKYDFLSGGWVLSGETPEQAAKREVEEEVGVKNPDLKFLFKFRFKSDIQNDICYVYKVIYDGEIIIDKDEVESYEFIPLDKLDQYMKEHDFCDATKYICENYKEYIIGK